MRRLRHSSIKRPDAGHSIDLYSEFTCTGGRYERFPDLKNHRIFLTDLRRLEILKRLRLVFTDPHALDPSKRAAEVTRDIATRLARLAKSQSIRQQDAVLAYDERIPRRDPDTGEILTIWDGHSTKPHPVTGKLVPDESARTVLFDYINPRRAEWPKADYIVGDPPFIGASRMREALGDGYTEALRKAWKGDVPESADFVMFWWCKAAAQVAHGRCKRFGFITTNSIHQTFNRRVIEPFLSEQSEGRPLAGPANGKRMAKPIQSPMGSPLDSSSTPHSHGPTGGRPSRLHLAYAISDHPWIDSADGAAVRIAMTVAAPGKGDGILEKVTDERPMEHGENEVSLVKVVGVVAPNFQIGSDLTSCAALLANSKLSCPGVKLHGSGFIVSEDEAKKLGLRSIPNIENRLKGFRNGKDLTDRPRHVRVIDLFGLSEEEARSKYPTLYQHVLTHVKPERDQNNRDTYRINWWIFGEPRRDFRPALKETAATDRPPRHRSLFHRNTDPPKHRLGLPSSPPKSPSSANSSPPIPPPPPNNSPPASAARTRSAPSRSRESSRRCGDWGRFHTVANPLAKRRFRRIAKATR